MERLTYKRSAQLIARYISTQATIFSNLLVILVRWDGVETWAWLLGFIAVDCFIRVKRVEVVVESRSYCLDQFAFCAQFSILIVIVATTRR